MWVITGIAGAELIIARFANSHEDVTNYGMVPAELQAEIIRGGGLRPCQLRRVTQ